MGSGVVGDACDERLGELERLGRLRVRGRERSVRGSHERLHRGGVRVGRFERDREPVLGFVELPTDQPAHPREVRGVEPDGQLQLLGHRDRLVAEASQLVEISALPGGEAGQREGRWRRWVTGRVAELGRLLAPREHFGPHAEEPVVPERDDESQRAVRIAALEHEPLRGADLGEQCIDVVEGRCRVCREAAVAPNDLLQHPRRVPAPHSFQATGRFEAVGGERLQGLEQHEPTVGCALHQ